MNSQKLKGVMVEKGFTQLKVSKNMGLSVQALNAKINCKKQFTLDEVVKITSLLEIDDPREIFFDSDIPNKQRIKDDTNQTAS